jgi:hypothetical protein
MDIFNQPSGNPGSSPWRREGIVFMDSVILIIFSMGLHIDLDQLESKAIP